MVAKRYRALALLLALPSAAFALGLGDIHLLSPLNAPLDAEIEVVDAAPDEINTMQAQLASRDTFAQNGLDWPGYLATVQVRTVHTPDGRTVVKLRSSDAVSDPFLTLLVEVTWPRGHLVREYTMLLDPPVYAPGQSQVANAPVSAPTTGSGAHEGAIARANAAPAAPPPAPAAPSEPVAAPASSASAESAPSPSSTSSSGSDQGGTRVVQRGDTLSHIAASVSGSDATTARARSWMYAIYQANPKAFDQNMNVLRTGAVLRIPDAATVAAVSPTEATQEIRRQNAAWRSSAGAPAESASGSAQPGRLKLVTPAQNAAAGATSGAQGAEVASLQGRVHDLESQLAEQKRLVELRNQDLARMQAQLAAKQAAQTPPTSAATPPPAAPPPAAPPAEPPAATAAQAPAAPPPAATEEKPPEATATPEQKPAATTAVSTPAKAPSSGGVMDLVKSYWWALLALAVLVVLLVLRAMRSRRASEFDDSLGRLAVAGAGAADYGTPNVGRSAAPAEAPAARPVPVRTPAAPVPDEAFLVEESGSHERPRLPTGAAAPAPTPRHVASDETISSETAINLDQGDPLAEADFHMAYGLYDQAADLIRIAISREPTRRDLKLKLLEVFFVWGNKEQFLQTARELAETRSEAAPGEWEKILIMGKQLAPEDPLFAGGGAVTGAAAGGVDLDLEGGQSRVDFDLLGEPVPADAPQGVDLDIGAAVGEHDGGTESTTNVTDRNAALLENSFTATTGTTRQMTQRMRQESPTGEYEGPTVEQPQLHTADNPTVRQKVETAMRQGGADQTAELAIDDLGLDVDVGAVDTVDQPGPASPSTSTPDAPTLVAGLDDRSRKVMEDARERAVKEETGVSTGAWSFDQNELEAALTQTSLAVPDPSATSRLAALKGHDLDVDVGEATGTHRAPTDGALDFDLGGATGTHQMNGGLDLDVGTATVPDTAFAATQKLSSEDLALPDLEPVTMSEVGTKLDLARAYMDMGDPDGARNILEEVLNEGSAAQKQEAQRLMESLPG
jgi:pilus assembly protein FimV